MSTQSFFEFSVDRENKTIHIKREFNAELSLVWEAWTTSSILEQWAAPKPWRVETKTMDFREGGYWHYAMVSPEGNKSWTRYDYQKIELHKSIVELRGFCDEDGVIDPNFPRTQCTNIFSESDGKTLVSMSAVYGSSEILERMVTLGFTEGMKVCMENLDQVLEGLK